MATVTHRAGPPLPVRVLKLGGSLLQRPDLWVRLKEWQIANPPPPDGLDLLIMGGGLPVRQLKVEQQRCGFPDQQAHWRAIELMDSNLRAWLQRQTEANPGDSPLCLLEATLLTSLSYPRLRNRAGNAFAGLLVSHALRSVPEETLPRDWRVSSDSIAAFFAQQWQAPLVLFKSALRSPGTARVWSQAGYVDPWFPALAGGLRSVRAVCFPENLPGSWASSVCAE